MIGADEGRPTDRFVFALPWYIQSFVGIGMNKQSEKIQELKKMLVMDESFDRVFKFFLDIAESDKSFMSRGKRYKDKILKAVIAHVGESVFQTKCSLTNLMLIMCSSDKLVHGSCVINGHLTVVLFFPDIQMGMAAITMAPLSNMTHFARITTTVVEGSDPASFVRPSGRTLQ